MFLIIHILLATFSVIYSFFIAIVPSKAKLLVNYSLIIGTVLSGGVVAFESPQYLGKTCIEGVIYLGIMTLMLIVSQKRIVLKEFRGV